MIVGKKQCRNNILSKVVVFFPLTGPHEIKLLINFCKCEDAVEIFLCFHNFQLSTWLPRFHESSFGKYTFS